MRVIHLSSFDSHLFSQDVQCEDLEFFRNHSGAFKRMWEEQGSVYWRRFVLAFSYYVSNFGMMKDLKFVEFVDEGIQYLLRQFVGGRYSMAKNVFLDSCLLEQSRHLLNAVGGPSCGRDPFFKKETREVYRRMFGQPNNALTLIRVHALLPYYSKFGGSILYLLRIWLRSNEAPPSNNLRWLREFRLDCLDRALRTLGATQSLTKIMKCIEEEVRDRCYGIQVEEGKEHFEGIPEEVVDVVKEVVIFVRARKSDRKAFDAFRAEEKERKEKDGMQTAGIKESSQVSHKESDSREMNASEPSSLQNADDNNEEEEMCAACAAKYAAQQKAVYAVEEDSSDDDIPEPDRPYRNHRGIEYPYPTPHSRACSDLSIEEQIRLSRFTEFTADFLKLQQPECAHLFDKDGFRKQEPVTPLKRSSKSERAKKKEEARRARMTKKSSTAKTVQDKKQPDKVKEKANETNKMNDRGLLGKGDESPRFSEEDECATSAQDDHHGEKAMSSLEADRSPAKPVSSSKPDASTERAVHSVGTNGSTGTATDSSEANGSMHRAACSVGDELTHQPVGSLKTNGSVHQQAVSSKTDASTQQAVSSPEADRSTVGAANSSEVRRSTQDSVSCSEVSQLAEKNAQLKKEVNQLPQDKIDVYDRNSVLADGHNEKEKMANGLPSDQPWSSARAARGKLRECSFCQKREPERRTFKKCVRCTDSRTARFYCGRDCQAADWKARHREEHRLMEQ